MSQNTIGKASNCLENSLNAGKDNNAESSLSKQVIKWPTEPLSLESINQVLQIDLPVCHPHKILKLCLASEQFFWVAL